MPSNAAADVYISVLQGKFKTICQDYMDPLTLQGRSKAVELYLKMIFELGK